MNRTEDIFEQNQHIFKQLDDMRQTRGSQPLRVIDNSKPYHQPPNFVPNVLELRSENAVLKEHLAYLKQRDIMRQAKYDSLYHKYNFMMEMFLGLVTLLNESSVAQDGRFSHILRNYAEFAANEGNFLDLTKSESGPPPSNELVMSQSKSPVRSTPESKGTYLPFPQSVSQFNESPVPKVSDFEEVWARIQNQTFHPVTVADSVPLRKKIFESGRRKN